MADRTSARIFGDLFRELAQMPQTEEVKHLARWAWACSQRHDFSDCQLEADKALIKLGLAKMGVDPEYPSEGVTVIYANRAGVLPD